MIPCSCTTFRSINNITAPTIQNNVIPRIVIKTVLLSSIASVFYILLVVVSIAA